MACLEEDCLILGVARRSWHEVTTLRLKYETVAVAGYALRLMTTEGRAWSDALLRASVELGVKCEAVRKRLAQWNQVARALPDRCPG